MTTINRPSSVGDGGSRAPLPPLTKGPHSKRLGQVAIIATFGGLLFGYDTAVINGALNPMVVDLHLTKLTEGGVTSGLLFGAAVGAILGGRLSDGWGRRKSIILMSILFFVGAMLCVVAPSFGVMLVGRIILGLAVGAASTIVPVFLAELAPYEIRGSLAGRNEMMIVLGQLAAFVINAIISSAFGEGHGVWRIMLAVEALPAIALFIGMLRMPESPRWLASKGRDDEALKVLSTLRTSERAKAELAEIDQVTAEEGRQKGMPIMEILRNKWLLRIILVGIGLGVAQQLTGINAIQYYGQTVLIQAGFAANVAIIVNIGPGIVGVIGAIIALRMMDHFSRRRTFIIGFTCTTVIHILIGILSNALPDGNAARPWVLLVLIILFVGSVQTFLNVAVWVTLSEIFPLKMRGFGIGISVFFLWIANAFLGLYFPTIISAFGITGTFFGFAVINALALLFVWRAVPETRGRSLEKLEEDVTTGAIYTQNVKKTKAPIA